MAQRSGSPTAHSAISEQCTILHLVRWLIWRPSFTVGCKTEDGFTVILVERSEGLETKAIKTSYSSAAGTSFVTFDNCKVPVENTLGEEGGGIFVMLSNFNHERWVMCCSSVRSQRMVVEECLKSAVGCL